MSMDSPNISQFLTVQSSNQIEILRNQVIEIVREIKYGTVQADDAIRQIEVIFNDFCWSDGANYIRRSPSQLLDDNQDSRLKLRRGPYKRYSSQVKEEAISKMNEGEPLKQVSNEMNIPKKNLKRWQQNGTQRKKGGGRKIGDETLEILLQDWCIQEGLKRGRPVTRHMIKSKALELSSNREKFKASKGWTDKFVKKFDLEQRGVYRNNRRVKQEKIEPVETIHSQENQPFETPQHLPLINDVIDDVVEHEQIFCHDDNDDGYVIGEKYEL